MRTILVIAALAVLTPGLATAQARQFNLECAGTTKTLNASGDWEEGEPATASMAIDLDANLIWMVGAPATFAPAAVTPDEIVIEQFRGTRGWTREDRVRRSDGDWRFREMDPFSGTTVKAGKCTVAPYTPMPKNLF